MDRHKAHIRMIEANVASSLVAYMAIVTSLLKIMALNNGALTGNVAQMNAINQVAVVTCVQCSDPHMYDMCPHNLQLVCSAE